MFSSQLFHKIAGHERFIQKHKNLFQLFCAAFEVTDSFGKISDLQKEFMIIEIAFSYSHFGFNLFASSSMYYIESEILSLCGVEREFTRNYLLHLKEFLKEDTTIENKEFYISENILEASFAREYIKRIFCTEQKDDIHTGLFIYERYELNKIRECAKKHNNTNFQLNSFTENEIFSFESIYNEFVNFLAFINKEPLALIVSRFESFINIYNSGCNSFFIFKQNNDFMSLKSKKITAILTLLIPHYHKNGQLLFKDSLLSLNQIVKALSKNFKSAIFNLKPIQNFFGVDSMSKEDLEFDFLCQIQNLLEEAAQCGVVFKVPKGNNHVAYGLSENGMKILAPYRTILTETIIVS